MILLHIVFLHECQLETNGVTYDIDMDEFLLDTGKWIHIVNLLMLPVTNFLLWKL